MFAKQPALTVEEALKLDLTCYREVSAHTALAAAQHTQEHAPTLVYRAGE